MIVERKMIHDIIELAPESEMPRIYAILNAYMALDNEDVLTPEQESKMQEGFAQIDRNEYISVDDYMSKRGLKL